MNIVLQLLLLCFFSSFALYAQPAELGIKDAIKKMEEEVVSAETPRKNELLLELAKAYYRDQNQEKAFNTLLKAIEGSHGEDKAFVSEDQRLYSEALAIYLDPHVQSTKNTSAVILEKYADVIKAHPDYILLPFLVGASYANAGQYTGFFDLFYRSYWAAPNHYMAYKTKAIIHIKLFERTDVKEEKELQRQLILGHLQKAAEIYPADHALYKMMVAFSSNSQKQKVVSDSLKKIIDKNIVIPRTDIGYYVEEAVKVRQFDLAQQLLDENRERYRFSRIINTAQEYLDQQRKGT